MMMMMICFLSSWLLTLQQFALVPSEHHHHHGRRRKTIRQHRHRNDNLPGGAATTSTYRRLQPSSILLPSRCVRTKLRVSTGAESSSAMGASPGISSTTTDPSAAIDDDACKHRHVAEEGEGEAGAVSPASRITNAVCVAVAHRLITIDDDGGPATPQDSDIAAEASHLLAERLGVPLVVRNVEGEADRNAGGAYYSHALRYVPCMSTGSAAAAIKTKMMMTSTTTTATNSFSSPRGGDEYALEIRSLAPPVGGTKKGRGARVRASANDDGAGLAMVVDWVLLLYGAAGGGTGSVDVDSATRTSRPGKDRLVQAVLGGRSRRRKRNNGDDIVGESDDDVFRIVDLTAGWGTDALTLLQAAASARLTEACCGCHVTLVERDPIVLALLRDAHRRLKNYEAAFAAIQPTYASRIDIVEGDGVEVATRLAEQQDSSAARPDVVYLDPMFPPRTKSAAVKKPMQILHSLLHTHHKPPKADDSFPSGSQEDDADADVDLLEAALTLAKERVVVKRPIKAEPLGRKQPAYALTGGAHRWDVYITRALPPSR